LKVWANLVASREHSRFADEQNISDITDSTSKDRMEISREISEEMTELLSVLFNCIADNGNTLYQASTGVHNAVYIYEVAAECILNLLRIPQVSVEITVDQWQSLAWTLLNEDTAVRARLFEIYSNIMQTSVVHLRFLSYFCLYANDDDLRSKAESAFLFVVQRLRRTHEKYSLRALAADNTTLHLQADEQMPEVILPYVIYLLSYHPEFPESSTLEEEADKKRMGHIYKSVKMVLRVLLESLENEADNLSYLLKQVNLITRDYEDMHDASNLGLHVVARGAHKVLTESIKTAENVQAYPGDIPLPSDLYQLRLGVVRGRSPSLGSIVVPVEGLDQAEEAIDNALSRLGKGRGKKSPSKQAVQPKVRQASAGRKPKSTSQTSQKFAQEDFSEDEDLCEVDEKPVSRSKPSKLSSSSSSSSSKTVRKNVVPIFEDVPRPVSSRPQRKSRDLSIKYTEKDEDEKEVRSWDKREGQEKEKREGEQNSRGGSMSKSVLEPLVKSKTDNIIIPNGLPHPKKDDWNGQKEKPSKNSLTNETAEIAVVVSKVTKEVTGRQQLPAKNESSKTKRGRPTTVETKGSNETQKRQKGIRA